MDFYRSEKSNQEKENLRTEIQELKELVQKNTLLIKELSTQQERSSLFQQEKNSDLFNESSENVSIFEELTTKVNSLEERIAQDKQETLSEYQKFIKSGSPRDYKETFEHYKDPLPLVEERLNKKIHLLNKTQEETQNQIGTLTEALDMLGNGMEELHNLINLKTPKPTTSHTSDEDKQQLKDFVNNLESFKNEIQNLINEVVNDKFTAISSLLATITSKANEINKIISEHESQTPVQAESKGDLQSFESKDDNSSQWP